MHVDFWITIQSRIWIVDHGHSRVISACIVWRLLSEDEHVPNTSRHTWRVCAAQDGEALGGGPDRDLKVLAQGPSKLQATQ